MMSELQIRSWFQKLFNINKIDGNDIDWKNKVKWLVEGDENSKFFHDILKQKRKQMAIQGIIVDR